MFGSNVVGRKFGRKAVPKRPWNCPVCNAERPGGWANCPTDMTPRPKET